ncbi:MAG: WG repeat-containing protein [Oscillospiraceae bacterium]|nr:WG repeat-containing protein [Oscillospiraceae bacterium]
MKKKVLSAIIVIIMVTSLTFTVNADGNFTGDATKDWQYVVPLCKYDHCEILSNGLIKIGKTIGWDYWACDEMPPDPVMLYGLLDSDGEPLTDMIYDSISSPNNDGYILAAIKNGDGKAKYVLFDGAGNILPTPDDAIITLFPDSYYMETAKAFTFCFDNKLRTIPKSVLENAGVCLENENEYLIDKISGIYSHCFVMNCDYGSDRTAFVFGWDGTLRYKTHNCIGNTPDGLILMNDEGNQSFVDFDGKELITAAYRQQIYALRDYTTYEFAPGLYVCNMGLAESLLDINNPNAFKGLTFETVWNVDSKNKTLCIEKEPYVYGLYSFDGTKILPCEYANIWQFSDGLVRFQTQDNKFGLANMKGEIVFETDYELFWDFSEGFLGYMISQDNGDFYCGFLNSDFKPVIRLDKNWYIQSGFQDGLAAVSNNEGEIMFINREGKVVIAQGEPQYLGNDDSNPVKWQYTYRSANGLIAVAGHAPVAYQHNGPIMYDEDGIIKYLDSAEPAVHTDIGNIISFLLSLKGGS